MLLKCNDCEATGTDRKEFRTVTISTCVCLVCAACGSPSVEALTIRRTVIYSTRPIEGSVEERRALGLEAIQRQDAALKRIKAIIEGDTE